jgi:H+-translocating NAD(P) transhydrogenase subunit alpha
VPLHSSQLYSRNLMSFLALILNKGELKVDMQDEILKGACVAYQGGNVHPKLAAAIGQPAT